MEIYETKKNLKFFIRPNTTDIKVIDEVINKNVYNKKKINFLFDKNQIWLDLGANIGTFTILVMSLGCKTYSFEPEPENFDILKKNIALNNFDNAKLFNKGMNYNGKDCLLYICKGDYNKYRHSIHKRRGRTTINIEMVSLEKFLSENLDINSVKIDIEGAEIDILENIKNWYNVDRLVFEYSFDVDSSIKRFLRIIDKLKQTFSTVTYTKVIDTEEFYNYFPQATIVFCLI